MTALELNTSHIPENIGAPIGSNVTLSCGADLPEGVAEPTVKWNYLNEMGDMELAWDGNVYNITEVGTD